ncbi:two-component system sensor histidine kinase NtrB [Halalkalibacter krulwichiae]|uniref:histidine kinase n=1 Tax=Halalkalibacter krulwichiae TaxID=199441 RepID=A0A1X9M9K4_9BACI|nr:ATP-binding protein [Halalkalibacter krulwichiae]ARK29354.1 Sporulation kinase E [Halalkalibacter krulwichiae]
MNNRHLNPKETPKGSKQLSVGPKIHPKATAIFSTLTAEKMLERHLLMDQLGIPFLEVDQHLHILKWNQPFLEMTKSDEADLQLFSLKELSLINSFFLTSLSIAESALESNCSEERDFEVDEFLYKIKAIPFSDEKVVYLVFEDRSLQKQFENMLTFHHQMEAVSHIAAGVAHELRNPLSVIKGFLQLAKLTNDHNKYYDTVMTELNRMNGILEDFLSVSRRKMERRWQSPVQIMNSLAEIIKAECLLHDVQFHLQVCETEQLVYVNESMVKQVMLNILRNSVEAFGKSNSNRSLTIETMIENNYYVIEVKDNGKGMPESVLNQLGKPFFTTKSKGTGIGVPLCKKIIEDHGGIFQIQSTYNVGTSVKISLPLEGEKRE